ncbi:MAG: hypothetical protein GY813_18375 [Halieaceae bacterium]|nr:hypothetical protein [Halieaceae bacterium]
MVQREGGRLEAVSPEEAKGQIAAMERERRTLYDSPHPEDFDLKRYFGLWHHSQYDKEKGESARL